MAKAEVIGGSNLRTETIIMTVMMVAMVNIMRAGKLQKRRSIFIGGGMRNEFRL